MVGPGGAPQPGSQPGASPASTELVPEEARLGSSPAATAANAALRALSRAARAFTMYDSKNEIIRRFIGEYRHALDQAVAVHGALKLEVKPFELLLGADVVYREEDRERSLAFRLFRDGVRTLTVHPQLPFEECVRLLEVLSVRYSGVRQTEDDLVTLLRRAAFTRIEFTAVEGFSPAEEQPEATIAVERTGVRVHAPPDFDQPAPEYAPIPWGWREVPPQYLEAARAEERPATVTSQAVRLAIMLLREANGPASLISNLDVAPFCAEVRDACVAEGALAPLLALVRELKAHHGIGSDALANVVLALASHDQVLKLFDGIPPDAVDAPPALVELLAELPGNHVTEVVERLNGTEDPRLQRVLQGALVGLGKKSSESLLAALPVATASSASQVVSALMVTAPDQVLRMATELASRDDREAKLQAIGVLERMARSDAQSELLARLLHSTDEAVFAAAAHAMAVVHDRRGYDLIAREIEARATAHGLTNAMATGAGEALATLAPTQAFKLFKGWLEPKGGLLGRLRENLHDVQLAHTAVAGLTTIRGAEADEALRAFHAHEKNAELKSHAMAAIMKRRKLFGIAGAPGHG
ncbi:MAG: hypothetical protein U0228_03100 [Myxococcaceae bacterium]